LPDRSSVHDRAPSSGFIEPCLPTKVARPPSGPLWVHEIKHDGYRLMVSRDGSRHVGLRIRLSFDENFP
jgi:ATP-dependent DNA ligase